METQPPKRRKTEESRFEPASELQFAAVVDCPEPILREDRRPHRHKPGAPSERAQERRKWRESRAKARPAREAAAYEFVCSIHDRIQGPDDLRSLQNLMEQVGLRSFNNREARARKCHEAWLGLKKLRLERGGVQRLKDENHMAIAQEHFTKTPERQLRWKKLKYHSDPEHRQEVLERGREYRNRKLGPLRELLRQAKNGRPCVQCGFTGPSACFDFHHRDPAGKDSAISTLCGKTNTTVEQLQAELDKCDLLCANCHRAEHVVE